MRLPSYLRAKAFAFATCALFSVLAPNDALAAETIELTGPWKFQHESDAANTWQSVTLPHDWSIARPRSETESSAGGMGFFPTGTAQYRLEFDAPARWIGQKAFLDFEGSFRNTVLSVNGVEIARHLSGYTPFSADITEQLRLGSSNLIEVTVNNEPQPNSRWYTGSGLYRPVHLRIVDPVHIDLSDIAIKVWHLSEDGFMATMDIDAAVRNRSPAATPVTLDFAVIDPDDLPVSTFSTQCSVESATSFTANHKLAIPHPRLWSPATPHLYRLVLRSFVEGRMTDRAETTFGIRSIAVSADKGLLLNGQPIELFGANVHDDHGPLGTASYRDAAFRKARLLKQAGFNAVRTAHNPPSSDFLDACDQHGLLVIDEAFDGWKRKKLAHDYAEIFEEHWASDLDAMVLRDRRHPSVIMWSIGNEVYERGNAGGVEIAAAMAKRIRSLDPSRPITIGLNGLGPTGDWTKLDPVFASLDVAGYNYEIDRHADDHARLPKRVIYSSESYLNDAFKSWKVTTENPYVIGDFVWTAIDYLGEAGIGRVFPPNEKAFPHWEGSHFPWHGAACGDIDLVGWRKPISHYRNIVWDRGETLYAAVVLPTGSSAPWNLSGWATTPMLPSWTWPDAAKSTPLAVEVYSRHPRVRLYLNNKRIGELPTGEAEQFKAVFKVPYRPGVLRAVGLRDGQEVESFTLQTAAPTSRIALSPEEPYGQLRFVQVELTDANGVWNPSRDFPISYKLSGPARILTTGSAQLDSAETYGANPRSTFQGRALVVLELTGPGPVTLTAEAEGLTQSTVSLHATP